MAEDELRKYARLSTQIRSSFKAKADELKAEEKFDRFHDCAREPSCAPPDLGALLHGDVTMGKQ